MGWGFEEEEPGCVGEASWVGNWSDCEIAVGAPGGGGFALYW